MEPVSFRLTDDFKVKLGKDQTEVTIPRMKFKAGGDFFRVLSATLRQDSSKAIALLGSSIILKLKADNLADMPGLQAQYDQYDALLQKTIEALLVGQNVDRIVEIAGIVTDGKITKEVIESLDMTFEEVTGLLKYLIDANLDSLKNLFASLSAKISLSRSATSA